MKSKFDYIVSLFMSVYDIGNTNVEFGYGDKNNAKIKICKGGVAYFNKKQEYDIKNVIWKEWEGKKIPFLFDASDAKEILTQDNGNIIINYDIIASSFFFLSNWQEWVVTKKDETINRFPFEESIQYKLNIIHVPVVNYYFLILKHAIEKAYGVEVKSKREFNTFVSHDIDVCQSAWLQGSFRALLQKDLKSVFKLLSLKVFKEDAWFNFDEILALEKKHNIKSTFFFMSKKGKTGLYPNSDYNVGDKKFKNVFRKIESQNSEIGIHGSFGTCNSVDNFGNDIKKLEHKVIGNRFHFLEFDITKSIQVLEDSNIKFDSTMGFAEKPGFRNGICFPFYLYNIEEDKASTVIEIPLTLMDGSFQNKKYLNISQSECVEYISPIIEEIVKFKGVFTILWHNTFFSEYKYKGWKKVFEDIYTICMKHNAKSLSGKEIVESCIEV